MRTTIRPLLAAALVAAAGGASGQACNFRNPLPGDLLFGAAFDPSNAATQQATTGMRVQCSAAITPAWTFSGANGSSPLRMKHATLDAFIPYTVSVSFLGGPSSNQQWRVTATVLGPSYENAPVGVYSDRLTATILP